MADLPGSDGRPGLDDERAAQLLRFIEELGAAYEGREPSAAGPGGGPGFGRVAYDFDFTRLPILGEVALTYRCNERCRFCYASCGVDGATGEAACGDSGCGPGPGAGAAAGAGAEPGADAGADAARRWPTST